MELIGTHVVNASAQQVWDMLMTPEILAKVTPGISKLELEKEGVFKAIADIKMGPVNGKFEGRVEVLDAVVAEHFTLKVQQNSNIGNVSASIKMQLKPLSANQTELSFDGKAMLSGLLARTGNRVIGGVANTLTKQFFDNFEKELMQIAVPIDENAKGTQVEEHPPQRQATSLWASIVLFFRSVLEKLSGLFK